MFAIFVFLTAALATAGLAEILGSDGIGWTDGTLIVLFAILFTWICASFWVAMFGYGVLLRARFRRRHEMPPASGRTMDADSKTVLLVPIYNEDVAEVFARIEAMHLSLKATAFADRFDFFILSDSTDPETWIREEIAWDALRRRIGAETRIFYRHRTRNTGYKSGNIAEFCCRWGRRYRYMIVLDADSLMSGETMVELVRRMDGNPRLGLLQTPPTPIRGRTLFARMQQFGASLYGPAHAFGTAFWQLGEGNYWGHNAIIRVEAFMRSCGLPSLPGRRPFGGQILSHDFVEAALLRRAGWEVRLAPDLSASFEEPPATLLAYAKRDYRWCQGNLQHVRVLFARHLHPVSRLHLAMGIMTYVSAPLWLLFVLISAFEVWFRTRTPHAYFSTESLFPIWPIGYATEAITLLGVTLALLYLPKLLGLAMLLADREGRRAFGGGFAVVAGVLAESVLAALIAPIQMAFHTRFVILTLLGQDTGWGPQDRARKAARLREVVVAHAGHVLGAAAGAAAAYYFVPTLFWWLLPMLVGPTIAIPINLVLASNKAGEGARRLSIFRTPSELRPPLVLTEFRNARERAVLEGPLPASGDAIDMAVRDPFVNALHVALLDGERPRARHGGALAEGLVRRVEKGGLSALSDHDQRYVLSDAYEMMRLHALAYRQVPGAFELRA